MQPIRRLPGMKYESPQELGRRTAVQDGLRDLFSSHGYQCIDTPLLEPTELFLRKSGGELAARMYTFTDPGGNRVSLRPEFTSSAIQYYLERADTEPLPLKLQYNGPVFRYDESTGYRQFHQMGAEIIGSDEPSSDGEVLALAREGLSLLGVSRPVCVIGHVGVLHRMLDGLGISPRAQEFLIAGFPRLKQGDEGARTVQEQARSLGLLTSDNTARGLRMLIEGRDEAESFDLLQDLFQESLTGLLGSRTMEDILTRFTDKLQRVDDPQGIETGIALFSRLASIAGDEESALPQIRSVTEEFGLSPERTDAPGGGADRLSSALPLRIAEHRHRPGTRDRLLHRDGLRHHCRRPGRSRGAVRGRSLQQPCEGPGRRGRRARPGLRLHP